MAIVWTGPWSSADIPAGPGFPGWSNFTTGAGAFKTRYRDGDPIPSALWRELAGNLNYSLAQSRRAIWLDSFIGTGVASTDPTKVNTGTDWTARDAIYAVVGPVLLTPNARRGDYQPPRLHCRVRARRNGGAANSTVRLYSAESLQAFRQGWAFVDGNSSAADRVSWTINKGSYSASPGWEAEEIMSIPKTAMQTWQHPAGSGLPDIDALVTYLVLAGIGDGVNGPLIAAIQVLEEAPAA